MINDNGTFINIKLDDITPDTNQPRKFIKDVDLFDLRDSIAAVGVTTPIMVRKDSELSRYIIIAGERRWRASKLADIEFIPCIVIDDADCEDIEFVQLAENLDRSDLNPLDLAFKIEELIKKNGRDFVAEKLGKSSSWISKRLVFMKLCSSVQDLIRNGYLRDVASAKKLDALAISEKTNDKEKFKAAVLLMKDNKFQAKEFFKRGFDWRSIVPGDEILSSVSEEDGLADNERMSVIKEKKLYWRGALEFDEIIKIIKKTTYLDTLENQNISIETMGQEELKELVSEFRVWLSNT